MYCCVCGRTGRERPIYKLATAMSPDLGLCVEHWQRYQGPAPAEADRLLAEHPHTWAPPSPPPKCLHCGQPVIVQSFRSQPVWCHACEAERRRLA